MTGFQMDTSGAVQRPGFARPLAWSDLSPFEQGYVEALFANEVDTSECPWCAGRGHVDHAAVLTGPNIHSACRSPCDCATLAFDCLAPEALALILKDCTSKVVASLEEPHAYDGKRFWERRQSGDDAYFPPLAPTLSDDGKVYLRQAQEAQS